MGERTGLAYLQFWCSSRELLGGHRGWGSFAGSGLLSCLTVILLDFPSPALNFLLRISVCVSAFPSVIALPLFLFSLFWGVLFSDVGQVR